MYCRHRKATTNTISSFPICKICDERGKTMAQVHAEKEKARLDELAKKEYYEKLKIVVELKELEQRAIELGIETQDLTGFNKGATSNEIHQR